MPSLRELLGFGKSEGANNLVILNGYPLAVVVAISLHILLLGGLVYLQSSSQSQALELIQPTVIKALLIEENPQITNQRNQDNRRLEAKRKETERANAAAQKKREEQAAERKRQEEAAQKREQQQVAKQRADAKAKAEREKTLVEEERKKREAESQREAEKRREEQAQRERESRQQREREDAAAAEAASSEFELIQSATGLIQQLVTENWSRPPSARNGMRAIIQIKMLPTGELVDVIITQSSGDPAFDRSAENAVYRAAPFAELTALPIRVFNQNFRTLSLIFQPEDLLN
ncbi:cell envelope integrity protein TolA [Gammaproteobacteria bacterium]|jgi:colicin import membrane protein|nr:cell envelope integrity protein TolA [Gammaproteobacteria bacterium]MCH9855815.1 cell envelope integrity protein TolA [Gammaproteobacteria bacterium]MDA8601670.1 cell envelope integrity protein TolA [Gammaproteobacteria bacterium]MDC1422307.1 cell envelope integrity protein TolA [Gammaproteobacteria bacterium]MDC1510555.1 cell envelope integrity protein TolA [Gammaproteobacteria bacterium]